MRPAEIWSMSPAQIVRMARNASRFRNQDHRHDIVVAWMTSAWQRSKKMPTLDKVLRPTHVRPGLDEIVAKLNSLKKG